MIAGKLVSHASACTQERQGVRGKGTSGRRGKQKTPPGSPDGDFFLKGEAEAYFFSSVTAPRVSSTIRWMPLRDAVGQADVAHGVFTAQEVVLLGSQAVVGQGFVTHVLVALEELAEGVGELVIVVEPRDDGRTDLDMQVGEFGEQLFEVAEDQLVADADAFAVLFAVHLFDVEQNIVEVRERLP